MGHLLSTPFAGVLVMGLLCALLGSGEVSAQTVWRTDERGPMRVLAVGESLLWMNHNGGECEIRRGSIAGQDEPETRARLSGSCAGIARTGDGLVAASTEGLYTLDEGGRVRDRRPGSPPGPIYQLSVVAGRAVVLTPGGLHEAREQGYVLLSADPAASIAGDAEHYFIGRRGTVDRCTWSDRACERAAELPSSLEVDGMQIHDGRLLLAVRPPHRSEGEGGIGWLEGDRLRWLARGAFAPTGLFVHGDHIYFSGRQGHLRRVPVAGGRVEELTRVSIALLPGRVAPVGDRFFYAGGPHSDRLFYAPLVPR